MRKKQLDDRIDSKSGKREVPERSMGQPMAPCTPAETQTPMAR